MAGPFVPTPTTAKPDACPVCGADPVLWALNDPNIHRTCANGHKWYWNAGVKTEDESFTGP